MELQNLTLDIEQHIEINAPIGEVFEGLLHRLTDRNTLPMRLERRPGGRWFRDLGGEAGHLWGLVQVIKPPTLLEIHGPLFMSYAVAGHLQFRLASVGDGTRITLRHRALGQIEDGHRKGVETGWRDILTGVQRDCNRT